MKGLQQTLSSYEGTLQELHQITIRRHQLTQKVSSSFDLLGKKHKKRKVDEHFEREAAAERAEKAQLERIQGLVTRVEGQRLLIRDLRQKTRELDAARQAESDLVDFFFRSEGMVLDTHHGALEDAVVGLAPRIFRMREECAATDLVHAKLESAAMQLKTAAEELEQAFEPSHRPRVDKFGEEDGEEFFDSAGTEGKLQAAKTSDRLVKAAVLNMSKARQRMVVLPGLQPEDAHGLSGSIEPLFTSKGKLDSLESRKYVRDVINSLYVSESQTRFAAQAVGDQGARVRTELHSMEELLTQSKSRLQLYRRELLSQVQEAKRSNSLRYSENDSRSALLGTGFDRRLKKQFGSTDSLSSMGDRVPSVNSGLSKTGIAGGIAGWT